MYIVTPFSHAMVIDLKLLGHQFSSDSDNAGIFMEA